MTDSGPTVAECGEDEVIRQLTGILKQRPDVLVGPGDDCAVVQVPDSAWQSVLKTDCIVEGVHFLTAAPGAAVGWKALARVVSDMAAMAAEPQHALVTLLAPDGCRVAYLKEIYQGLQHCAETYGISIVGGETSRGPCLILSVSMTGRVQAGRAIPRSGAKAGDIIFVTGRLGGSLAGHHLSFRPRLEEARWLAAHFPPHAMMDLSDGIAQDLPRMQRASGVAGFEIWRDKLPLNEGCTVENGLGDGEDYELLFAFSEDQVTRLQEAWAMRFPEIALTAIGRFTDLPTPSSILEGGWQHFSR